MTFESILTKKKKGTINLQTKLLVDFINNKIEGKESFSLEELRENLVKKFGYKSHVTETVVRYLEELENKKTIIYNFEEKKYVVQKE